MAWVGVVALSIALVACTCGAQVSTIYSTSLAFAAKKTDGTVVVWGDVNNGGDATVPNAVDLTGVDTIYSTYSAFAAKKTDGTVVAWGGANAGGDTTVPNAVDLTGVNTIYSTGYAFAALKTDGTVVAWGSASYGGDATGVDFTITSTARPPEILILKCTRPFDLTLQICDV